MHDRDRDGQIRSGWPQQAAGNDHANLTDEFVDVRFFLSGRVNDVPVKFFIEPPDVGSDPQSAASIPGVYIVHQRTQGILFTVIISRAGQCPDLRHDFTKPVIYELNLIKKPTLFIIGSLDRSTRI
jgi:hypothetical protein